MTRRTGAKAEKEKHSGQNGEHSLSENTQFIGPNSYADVLTLQRAAGNQAVSQMLRQETENQPALQTMLRIGQPGDKYEQEADRVAEHVMQMGATEHLHYATLPGLPQVQRQVKKDEKKTEEPWHKVYSGTETNESDDYVIAGISQKLGGKTLDRVEIVAPKAKFTPPEGWDLDCFIRRDGTAKKFRGKLAFVPGGTSELTAAETKSQFPQYIDQATNLFNAHPKKSTARPGILQRAASGTISFNDAPPAVNKVLQADRGRPLDDATRTFMESRFEVDFSSVRVHEDADANLSAQAVNAVAYTVGNHIVFGAGQSTFDSTNGKRLLAHELAHVVQQRQNLAPQDVIQRREEPPLPASIPPVKVPFREFPDHQFVSDPTGRTRIRLQRKDNDLFYFLPKDPTPRRVPRPIDTMETPPKPVVIESIIWGGDRPYQISFQCIYTSPSFGIAPYSVYTVNIHGMGRLQGMAEMLLALPPALEVAPTGLETERAPDILDPARPRAKRFEDAQRYHMPDATFSLYIFPDRRIEVVEDATSKRLWLIQGQELRDLKVSRTGNVKVTWADRVGEVTVQFSLHGPFFTPTALGKLGVSDERTLLLSKIRDLGITLTERGSQFTDVELEAAWDVLQRWQATIGIVESLKASKAPGLTLVKDASIGYASYDTDSRQVKIPGVVESSLAEQRSTIIHELTHALFHAKGLMTPNEGAVPESVSKAAKRLEALSKLGEITEGPVINPKGPDALSSLRTTQDWEKKLSTNNELNQLWTMLHRRFNITDAEGTGDIRGLEVADESRYLGSPRGDVVGHGFDNVNEFVASFVASTLRFQDQMLRTVEQSNDFLLVSLYRRLWDWVNSNFVELGSKNPYETVLNSLNKKPASQGKREDATN